jgi:C-terminal processing protease CtpA/Prc
LRLLPICLSAAILVAASDRLVAQAEPRGDARYERLASLGRLWVSIKYFHPWLTYRPIDWDAALDTAVSEVATSPDRAGYVRALERMLSVLGDPVTRVRPTPPPATAPSPGEPDPRLRWMGDSVLVISLRNSGDLDDWRRSSERLSAIADTARLARRVVFDLRTNGLAEALPYIVQESGIASVFTGDPVRAPAQRGRMHSGYPPEQGSSSGGYWTGFYTVNGATVPAGDSLASGRRAAVLVNEQTLIPEQLLALRAGGRAVIVADGGLSESSLVKSWDSRLSDSVEVSVRLTELVSADTPIGSVADTVLDASTTGTGDAALATAAAVLRQPAFPQRHGAASKTASTSAPVGKGPETASGYPALAQRFAAAFKIWAVGQYFFPYRDLIGESWDSVLVGALAELEQARDSLEYGLALARMSTHLHDSHVRVTSPALRAYWGTASAPVFLRMIEGQPVIAHSTDDSAATAARARIGDVVLKVDGEDARIRLRRFEQYISASTPQALRRNAALRLTSGAPGSTVRLRVRGSGGRERELTMTRMQTDDYSGRRGPIFRVLPGNIGYADLGRLAISQVDSMFDALARTRAIVFDMRGYPLGTAWSIAPRLTQADIPVAARFSRPTAMSPDTTEHTESGFTQPLPHTDKPRYLRPTVMLINELTQSQAEHTGLFLEVANGTKFIGSPTAGANGDVTTVLLPGNAHMSFSGHAVRHADGRRLQRMGLVPDLRAQPTIAGLRAGRDEVLEAALRYFNRQREPAEGRDRSAR